MKVACHTPGGNSPNLNTRSKTCTKVDETGHTRVSGFTPVSVTVTYRWPRAADANANPTGGPVSSTFVQVFDRVFRFGELPPGV